jgi:DNA-binding transcriptional MerR regulator
MGTMTIGVVARRVGVEPSAIRYYEGAGLLPPPLRVNGRRAYGEDAVRRLALIRAAKAVGFTIAELRTLVSAWESQGRAPREWRRFIQGKVRELDGIVSRARAMKKVLSSVLACGCWDDLDMPLDAFIDLMAPSSPSPEDRKRGT